MKDTQFIGLDVGRGYLKGYTEYNGVPNSCLFKSVTALGRMMDFKDYKDPIFLEVDGYEYFVGILAEKEGHNPIQNLKDDKTTPTVQRLINAALNKLAVCDNVKIMLGVPNKLFKKSELQKIKQTYKDKVVNIKDKISNSYKRVKIDDIEIYREGDAALLWHMQNYNMNSNDVGMVTIGFRTTEFSYYDKGLMFNNLKSSTEELGNKDALEYIQKRISTDNIMRKLHEIDSSDRYDDLKEIAYTDLTESIEQQIESKWTNLNELDVFIAGGTALNMDFNTYPVVEDSQMITAKGLWLVALSRFAG